MLRIAICDDETEMCFTLRYKLERIFERRNIDGEIFEFTSGVQLLQWYNQNTGGLELVFLDIEMGGSNGMETAKMLRMSDDALQMVFVTGHSDYVFDGYAVGALDYLMKPASEEVLDNILSRALKALHLNSEAVFLCRSSEGIHRLPMSSILYFSSEKRKLTCFTQSTSYTFYGKLGEIEREVGKNFVRIHQRYLVNAAAVERITANEVLIEVASLPISRSYQKNALLRLTQALLD